MPTIPTEIKTLARAYTEKGIQVLGGYINSDQVEPDIKLRSIAIMFDRGWGKPAQDSTQEIKVNSASHCVNCSVTKWRRAAMNDELMTLSEVIDHIMRVTGKNRNKQKRHCSRRSLAVSCR